MNNLLSKINMKKFILIITLLLTGGVVLAQNNWKPLIGEDLSNWKKLGGNASYELTDGIITGRAVTQSPNTFLTTK